MNSTGLVFCRRLAKGVSSLSLKRGSNLRRTHEMKTKLGSQFDQKSVVLSCFQRCSSLNLFYKQISQQPATEVLSKIFSDNKLDSGFQRAAAYTLKLNSPQLWARKNQNSQLQMDSRHPRVSHCLASNMLNGCKVRHSSQKHTFLNVYLLFSNSIQSFLLLPRVSISVGG